jgi:Mg2+ and Co2+ transporter CorA
VADDVSTRVLPSAPVKAERLEVASPAPDRTGPSACYVVHQQDSGEMRFSRDAVEKLLARGGFFWLDRDRPVVADFEILRQVFGFHPLAVEDSEHFNQRAKIDEYEDFVFIVVYGAAPDGDRLVEVHCFYCARFLLTLHHDDCPAFAEIRRRYQKREKAVDQPSMLLYRIIDGLVDSFFPILAAFDDRIDELETAIFLKADDKQLQEIFQMKRLLVGMRKAVSPQRDSFARLMGGFAALPGLADEDVALLPRHLRPPDPDQRPHRQLSGPADRGDGRLSLDRLEPTEQRHEAARRHRDDLPATQLAHGLLRSELRLRGQEDRRLGSIRRTRPRHRAPRARHTPRLLQAPRLVLGSCFAGGRARYRRGTARPQLARETKPPTIVP